MNRSEILLLLLILDILFIAGDIAGIVLTNMNQVHLWYNALLTPLPCLTLLFSYLLPAWTYEVFDNATGFTLAVFILSLVAHLVFGIYYNVLSAFDYWLPEYPLIATQCQFNAVVLFIMSLYYLLNLRHQAGTLGKTHDIGRSPRNTNTFGECDKFAAAPDSIAVPAVTGRSQFESINSPLNNTKYDQTYLSSFAHPQPPPPPATFSSFLAQQPLPHSTFPSVAPQQPPPPSAMPSITVEQLPSHSTFASATAVRPNFN